MSKTFRRAAMSTICMLIVAVMSLTGATYAWFTAGETATVSGMHMNISAAEGGVQISALKNGQWTNYASSVSLDSNLDSVKPVSSTDGENFFQVSFNPADGKQYKTLEATGTNVITHQIKLKNPGATDISVNLNAENSTISDAENANNNNVKTEISKAARIAFIVSDANGAADGGAVTYIWAPSDTSYVGIKGVTEEYFDAGTVKTDISETVAITSAEDCVIMLPKIAEDGKETEVAVTIVLWLEGQDEDCANKNAGGAFDVQLQFALVK